MVEAKFGVQFPVECGSEERCVVIIVTFADQDELRMRELLQEKFPAGSGQLAVRERDVAACLLLQYGRVRRRCGRTGRRRFIHALGGLTGWNLRAGPRAREKAGE